MIKAALRVFICAAIIPFAYAADAPDSEEWAFLTIINNFRAQNGLSPLQVSAALQASSKWMSGDMASKNYFSHTDSLGRDPFTRMAAFGYSGGARGENLAAGNADAQNAFNQWLNACDPDASGNCTFAHRYNMLGSSYRVIGIGRAYNPGATYRWYWTTDFGSIVDETIPGPGQGPPAPTIAFFTASPSSIAPGQSVTLAWNTSGATGITINNGVGNVSGVGSVSVTPGQSTTYTLTATNSGGTTTAQVAVAVSAPPPVPTAPAIAFFNASPSSIAPGQSATLSWNTSGAASVAISNGVGNVSGAGSVSVTPGQTTTYTLTASNGGGTTTAQVTVNVSAPPPAPTAPVVAFFSANPSTIATGQSATLLWNTSGAAGVTINNGVGGVSAAGSVSVTPAQTTTYVLTATNNGGTTTAQVTVNVSAPPPASGAPTIAFFNASPSTVIPGQVAMLTWSTSGDTTLTIDNDGGNLSGWTRFFVRPSQTTTYTLTASNGGGATTAKVTVTVDSGNSAPGPVISSFIAAPANIAPGQGSTLSWNTSGATAVTISNGVGNVAGTGSASVTPAQTTTYTLTAVNSGGVTITALATVTVSAQPPSGDQQPPTAPNLTSAVAKGPTAVDLSWTPSTDNVGVANYQILRNGSSLGTVPASSVFFADTAASPSTSYTYYVRAYDAAGNSTTSNAAQVTTPAQPASGACPGPATGAFTGCYYSGIELSGAPLFVRTDNQINFDWGGIPPAQSLPYDNYSVRWQGNFNFGGGDYTFNATTADGMRIYVDGNLVMDRWRDQAATSYRVRQSLSPGNHLITVEYYAHGNWSTTHLSWVQN